MHQDLVKIKIIYLLYSITSKKETFRPLRYRKLLILGICNISVAYSFLLGLSYPFNLPVPDCQGRSRVAVLRSLDNLARQIYLLIKPKQG